jgi:hypothetical protein
MTSQPAAGDQASGPVICKRPGCGRPLPAQARGRNRVFCSDDCAQRYHNHARIPAPAGGTTAGEQDPLTALDAILRQGAVLLRAARDQAAALDPASVRVQIAEAEAARRRAEAAAVTAQAHAAEASQETAALAEALAAARDQAAAAGTAAQHATAQASDAAAALKQLRTSTTEQITAIGARAAEQVTTARDSAARSARDRDDALAAARQARQAADTETSRARQAETDARAETDRVRADSARERDTLREYHKAQLAAAHDLTAAERTRAERAEAQLEAERTDRRTLTSHLTTPASDNGHPPPAGSSTRRGGARSK